MAFVLPILSRMPQKLPIFRAARLVGVSRGTLQKRLRKKNIKTFEGEISVADLLAIYPNADLSKDSEYERVQHIKETAFSRHEWKSSLPDAETLATRISNLSRNLVETQTRLSQYTEILENVVERLSNMDPAKNVQGNISGLLKWIKNNTPTAESATDPTKELMAQNTMLGIMSAHVRIQPSDSEFWLEGKSSILEAAVRSGISLNYGCTNGNCGLCKARVVSGEVRPIQHSDYVLSEAEKNMNYILLCSCTAVSDLVIEALEAKDENDIPHQEIVTRVKKVHQLNETMMELHLQTPRVQRLRFLAGQSVSLTFPDYRTINLPIASCPCDDRNLLFHLEDDGRDASANRVYGGLAKGDKVLVNGPHGNFLLNEHSGYNQIYIAYGPGFAPIKSLIEHAMAIDENIHMYLLWLVDKEDDLYLNNLCRSWNDALDEFHYHPILGGEISQTINDAKINLAECEAYVAGSKVQVKKTEDFLKQNGLDKDRLFTNHLDD